MIRVELIYDADCPAAGDARGNLREALHQMNLPPGWTEWERSSPATPESMRAFGSPTILVDGRDVAGIEAAGAASCRIYQPQRGRLAAIPPVAMIAAALRGASADPKSLARSRKVGFEEAEMQTNRVVQNDLAATGARAALFWGPGVLALVLTTNAGWWVRTIGWTAGLSWLATMCLWNSVRCRRVHCIFTGPFFLAMAVVTLLVGFRIFWLGNSTWNLLGDTILIGGVVLCCGPELIWGRYWRGAPEDSECQP